MGEQSKLSIDVGQKTGCQNDLFSPARESRTAADPIDVRSFEDVYKGRKQSDNPRDASSFNSKREFIDQQRHEVERRSRTSGTGREELGLARDRAERTASKEPKDPSLAVLDRLFNTHEPTAQILINRPEKTTGDQRLLETLVERLLVSADNMRTDGKEVRLTLSKDSAFPGTDIALHRNSDGTLCVKITAADAGAFMTFTREADSLKQLLLQTNQDGVTVEVDSKTDEEAADEDSQRRSRGLEQLEEDKE